MSRASVAGCVVALLTACTNTPSASFSKTYAVAYRLTASAGVTFDSVKYEDAQGLFVTVVAPEPGWATGFSANTGSYVRATAWVLSSGSGASVALRVLWTESGVSTSSDSSTAVTAAPGRFTLDIPRRQI